MVEGGSTVRGGRAPWYLYAVGLVALLWNLFGTFLWAGTSFLPDSFLADMPAEHRPYIAGLPIWTTISWGAGVLLGVDGAVMLLIRHRLAVPAFAVSFVAATVNQLFYVTNPPPEGMVNLPLIGFIIGFALFLFWFAWRMQKQGLLDRRLGEAG